MKIAKNDIIVTDSNDVWLFDANIDKNAIADVWKFRKNGLRVPDRDVPESIIMKAFGVRLHGGEASQ